MCLLFNRHLQKCPVILASFWSSPPSCQSCFPNFPFFAFIWHAWFLLPARFFFFVGLVSLFCWFPRIRYYFLNPTSTPRRVSVRWCRMVQSSATPLTPPPPSWLSVGQHGVNNYNGLRGNNRKCVISDKRYCDFPFKGNLVLLLKKLTRNTSKNYWFNLVSMIASPETKGKKSLSPKIKTPKLYTKKKSNKKCSHSYVLPGHSLFSSWGRAMGQACWVHHFVRGKHFDISTNCWGNYHSPSQTLPVIWRPYMWHVQKSLHLSLGSKSVRSGHKEKQTSVTLSSIQFGFGLGRCFVYDLINCSLIKCLSGDCVSLFLLSSVTATGGWGGRWCFNLCRGVHLSSINLWPPAAKNQTMESCMEYEWSVVGESKSVKLRCRWGYKLQKAVRRGAEKLNARGYHSKQALCQEGGRGQWCRWYNLIKWSKDMAIYKWCHKTHADIQANLIDVYVRPIETNRDDTWRWCVKSVGKKSLIIIDLCALSIKRDAQKQQHGKCNNQRILHHPNWPPIHTRPRNPQFNRSAWSTVLWPSVCLTLLSGFCSFFTNCFGTDLFIYLTVKKLKEVRMKNYKQIAATCSLRQYLKMNSMRSLLKKRHNSLRGSFGSLYASMEKVFTDCLVCCLRRLRFQNRYLPWFWPFNWTARAYILLFHK